MKIEVLRPHEGHDILKGGLFLEAQGSRPPPKKPYHRKPPRSAPSSPPPPFPHTGRSFRTAPSPSPSHPKQAGRRVSFSGMEKAEEPEIRRRCIKLPSRDLVMEEVKILKRGEYPRPPLVPEPAAAAAAAAAAIAAEDLRSDLAVGADASRLFSAQKLGPDPAILPKQIGFSDERPAYAGPAYTTSPSPSSLPFPALFLKKAAGIDIATKGLRCLLGLDPLII